MMAVSLFAGSRARAVFEPKTLELKTLEPKILEPKTLRRH
jgi:hypothetical protein